MPSQTKGVAGTLLGSEEDLAESDAAVRFVIAGTQRYTDIAVKLEKALEAYYETDEQAGKDAKKSSGGLID
ncbi:hypothetical protein [Prauserella halophila]|uniref:hypothetical protein n=1 Tax=Prauserella halophila TaxID=185641 RepID=UPI0020A33662|nr:hypothetical protein [Prauserella halophila]MCP2237888.1 hypothetical protein [Prauserella halophila]